MLCSHTVFFIHFVDLVSNLTSFKSIVDRATLADSSWEKQLTKVPRSLVRSELYTVSNPYRIYPKPRSGNFRTHYLLDSTQLRVQG